MCEAIQGENQDIGKLTKEILVEGRIVVSRAVPRDVAADSQFDKEGGETMVSRSCSLLTEDCPKDVLSWTGIDV